MTYILYVYVQLTLNIHALTSKASKLIDVYSGLIYSGAAKLASLKRFKQMWISKDEYDLHKDEYGSVSYACEHLVNRKCF